MSDEAQIPEPVDRCDHICLLDAGHVGRGESHQYGYELPPRALLADLVAEVERLRGERQRILACIGSGADEHSDYRGFCGRCGYQWPCAVSVLRGEGT